MPVSVNESIGFVNGPNKLGRNINDKIRMTPIIKPQNMNGAAMRGRRLPRNDLMSQTRPSDNAPDSIKNMSTPILLAPRKQFILIMQEYHNFCKVVDELQVGYTIFLLTFKLLFSYNDYYG